MSETDDLMRSLKRAIRKRNLRPKRPTVNLAEVGRIRVSIDGGRHCIDRFGRIWTVDPTSRARSWTITRPYEPMRGQPTIVRTSRGELRRVLIRIAWSLSSFYK